MDAMTALTGDIELADMISERSSFVAESKKSPHYAKLLAGLKTIAKHNNHLTDAQVDQLRRKRKEAFRPQVINRIKDVGDLRYANEETVEVAAILSKHKTALMDGGLSLSTSFSRKAASAIESLVAGGSTGRTTKQDGSRDHTAKRVHIATNNDKLKALVEMSQADKNRAMDAAAVINASDSEDPFSEWTDEQIKRKQAEKARREAAAAAKSGAPLPSSSGSSGTIVWSDFI